MTMFSGLYDLPSRVESESDLWFSMGEPTEGRSIEIRQRPWELGALLRIVGALAPRKIVEVGTFRGGTLLHFMRVVPTGAEFSVVDVMEGDPEHAREDDLPELWQKWAEHFGHTLHIYKGDSHDEEIVSGVRSRAPIDFLFIDADHAYDAVKADYENYGPCVRLGGIIALHDITLPQPVAQLWEEIQVSGRVTQQLQSPPLFGVGIGVVYIGSDGFTEESDQGVGPTASGGWRFA